MYARKITYKKSLTLFSWDKLIKAKNLKFGYCTLDYFSILNVRPTYLLTKYKMQFLADELIYFGQKIVQTQLALCENTFFGKLSSLSRSTLRSGQIIARIKKSPK